MSASTESAVAELLHEAVERLAPLDRTPCSAGEREAAEWLARRFGAIGGVRVELEDEPSWGTFPPTAAALGVLGVLAAALVRRGRRLLGGLLAAGVYAGIVDEAQNGPRIVRRVLRRRRSTVNVLAWIGEAGLGHAATGGYAQAGGDAVPGGDARGGDAQAGGDASLDDAGAGGEGCFDTLVVLAHHDAPQTGVMFDQTLQRRIYELAPQLIERARRPPPQWWLGLAGPLCTVAAALTGRRRPTGAAIALGLVGVGLVADLWRNDTVPGANDNLSGVAVLLALAKMLEDAPLPGLRVLLVSCGAEETLQDGIRAFVARHRQELDPARTCFLNLDTVGSPHLVMLEGEGPVWMEDYAGPWLRDMLARCAERLEIPLARGFRARASTDSVIPSRAGYPIATVVSVTDWRSPANYHLPTDTPENLDYGSVADASLLAYELARVLHASVR